MAWTSIRNHRLHWVRLPYAPQSEPKPRPLRFVLAHGLFVGNLASWYLSCAHALSAYGEVLMYDLRGHGKSALTPSGYRLESLSADLHELLAHLEWGEGPLHLIGHSYGGRVLLEWASGSPERVARLTLVDAPLSQAELPELGLPELEDIASRPDRLEALLEALPQPLQLVFQAGGRRARRALEAWWGLLAESSLCQDLSAEASASEGQLLRLRERLWAVYGARSPCLSSAQLLRGLLPSPDRLHIIPEAGHYLLNEAPTQLCAALISQLERGSDG